MDKKKILFVEDDLDVAEMLSAYFIEQGYETFVANWGADGIELIEKEKPDVTVLDIRLPDIDGWEILEQINNRGLPTRVIMLTHVSGLDKTIRFIKGGACDYITKPFDIENLRMRVRNALVLDDTVNIIRAKNTNPLVKNLMDEAENIKNYYGEKIGILQDVITQNERDLKRLKKSNSDMVEKHKKEVAQYKEELEHLERRRSLISIVYRVVSVILGSFIAFALYKYTVISTKEVIIFLPIIIILLLLIPWDRLKVISAKIFNIEAKVELNKE